jgi:hypothetical protein
MSYQKQNFANGEVLTASQLNHIEQGIVDVESAANATKGVVDKIIDPTLSLSGKAADAKATGDAVGELKEDIGNVSIFQNNLIGTEYSVQDNKDINDKGWLYDKTGYYAIGSIDFKSAKNIVIESSAPFSINYAYESNTSNTIFNISNSTKLLIPNNNVNKNVSIATDNVNLKTCLMYRDNEMSSISQEIKTLKTQNNNAQLVVDKSGSGDFTKLVDAIEEGNKETNTLIYVNAGVYDLVEELGDEYVKWANENARGIYLKNGIHLIFSSNAIVKLHNTSTRDDSKTWLSPFNAGVGGFTLENCVIDAKNCRYAVHDERDSDTDSYHNKYINCTMKLDNTENSAWDSKQCIGGGLGANGNIEIDGCLFETVNANNDSLLVNYHNSWSATAKSFVNVKNSYAVVGTFGVSCLGQSEEQTLCLFSGNSLTHEIIKETNTMYKDNMTVKSWNNEIRTN